MAKKKTQPKAAGDSHHPQYPQFNISCAIRLVEMVRNDELVEKRAEAGKHAWTLAGALAGIILGEWPEELGPAPPTPNPFDIFGKHDLSPYSNEESCNLMEKFCASNAAIGAEGLPVSEIIRIAMWLLTIFGNSLSK